MTGRITGKAYEKHAWMLIFVIGLLGLAGSLLAYPVNAHDRYM